VANRKELKKKKFLVRAVVYQLLENGDVGAGNPLEGPGGDQRWEVAAPAEAVICGVDRAVESTWL